MVPRVRIDGVLYEPVPPKAKAVRVVKEKPVKLSLYCNKCNQRIYGHVNGGTLYNHWRTRHKKLAEGMGL